MLQIKNICKQYKTGDLVQNALDDVTLNLRDNEFVAILGPSGSGKTTLLNIIGGLDRYDSGDLIINNISTKKYKDRDWDSYRNHTIGFVFQSYNLIPHQSILSNVEIALTISGISRKERRQRAIEALDKVGLGDQLHKKPNQMSGGQMQRVAIARALVNNPDILLADEPTGALDTETSIQVMELLKQVAKDKLVVMVTHNPELADEYATRIVKLRDGKIIDDSMPFEVNSEELEPPKHKNMGRASMSLLTSLSLSFNNLRTKKGRTFLTSFAGSIGIIGIALILSLSNGVNTYINTLQRDTMSSYPITIQKQSMDLSSIMEKGNESIQKELSKSERPLDKVYSNGNDFEEASTMTASLTKNNLTDFKKYLDNPNSEIHEYLGGSGIVYSYDTNFSVYTHDPKAELVNTDGSTLIEDNTMMGEMMNASSKSPFSNLTDKATECFSELLPDNTGKKLSVAITDNYDIVHGEWPDEYNEIVLVLNRNNEISASFLYQLGFLPSQEYKDYMKMIEEGKEIKLESKSWSYEEVLNHEMFLLPACDTYEKNDKGYFDSITNNTDKIEEKLKNAVKLKISGIVKPTEDNDSMLISTPVGYTKALTDYLIDYAKDGEIVKAQAESPNVSVLNGYTFSPEDDATKIADAKAYMNSLGVTDKANFCKSIMSASAATNPAMAAQLEKMSEQQLAAQLDNYLKNPDEKQMLTIYDNYISSGTYDDNMTAFGVVSLDAPSSISLYCDTFENKDFVADCITRYNETVEEKDKIVYTDFVGLLMSSITVIINVISYVLIAFVAVSLVVSSIMIGIITYISVLERTKEIGILRAIGASKKNISQVFNAETFIIGLFAGLLGIGVTLLLLIPGNALIHYIADVDNVNAILPVGGAIILVVLSVVLTLIGGLIPAKKAALKDPVTALRTE